MPSETLTIIVSILVPVIVVQAAFLFFVFRRMDRMEERLVQGMDERIGSSDSRLTERMDNSESRLIERMDNSESRLIERMDNSESRLIERMDASDEEREKMRLEIRDDLKEARADISVLQTGQARLEGAVDVLRGLVERFVTVPR